MRRGCGRKAAQWSRLDASVRRKTGEQPSRACGDRKLGEHGLRTCCAVSLHFHRVTFNDSHDTGAMILAFRQAQACEHCPWTGEHPFLN